MKEIAAQIARIAVPYVLAALGGALSERSGVINIALEGMLLVGAFAAAMGCLFTGSAAIGIAAGVGAGILLAALYGAAVIPGRADQIVSGVAATLLADAATRFFLQLACHSSSNSPRIEALSSTTPLVVATLVIAVATHLFLARTRLGLRLRVAGEHPAAAVSLGIAVAPLRWFGVLASGALAGLGGVWLAFDEHKFVANMSAGSGFIALAAMILGGWRPLGALVGCLVFAAARTLELHLASSGLALSQGTVQSIPYLLTIAALALRPKSIRPPAALGRP